MSAETGAEAVVRQWFDRVSKGDGPGAMELFDPEVSYTLQGTTPVSGTYSGLQSVVDDFLVPWRKQIDGEIVLDVSEVITQGDRVVVLCRGRAKTVFGHDYDNEYCFVFRVRDGRITHVNEFLDTALVETAAYDKKIA